MKGRNRKNSPTYRSKRDESPVEQALFGVLFTLTKEKEEESWKFAWFEVLVHFIQLFIIVFAQHYKWDISRYPWIELLRRGDVVNTFAEAGYTVYLWAFWIQLSFLIISLAICGWVAASFSSGNFPYVWPIRFARTAVSTLFKTLYISSLAVFVMSFSCELGESPPVSGPFPEKRCDRLPHLPLVVLSVPAAIVTVAVGYLMTVASTEQELLTHDVHAAAFSYATSKMFAAITVVDVLDVLWSESATFPYAILFCSCSAYALFVMFQHAPYMSMLLNMVEAGFYASLTYVSGVLIVLEGVHAFPGQLTEVQLQRRALFLTDLAVWGIAPVFAAVAAGMFLRTKLALSVAAELYIDSAVATTLSAKLQRSSVASIKLPKAGLQRYQQERSTGWGGRGGADARGSIEGRPTRFESGTDVQNPSGPSHTSGKKKTLFRQLMSLARQGTSKVRDKGSQMTETTGRGWTGTRGGRVSSVMGREGEGGRRTSMQREGGGGRRTSMQREGEGSGTPHSGSVARSRQGGGHTRIEDLEERIGHVVFRSISEVEIAARCMRLTDEHGNLDEGWLLAAELIIRAGMRQFASHPNVARLSMLYANFLYSVRRAHQVAGHQLVATKKMQNLDMDLRFQYFCRERQRAQSVGSPEAMDLVAFVEFSNTFDAARRHFKDSLVRERKFWSTLLQRQVDLNELATALHALATEQEAASRLYKTLVARHPSNVKLLHSHASFLAVALGDMVGAQHAVLRAQMAEDAQALEKKDALFGKQEKEEGNDAEGDGEGVIVIDSVGRMEMLSRRARAIFGYGIGELEGSNVSSLMPQPFATAHGKYLRRFQKTGEARVLGMKRTVLGLHKDGTVFPVTIFISQVPDSEGQLKFMGLVEAVPLDPERGVLYVTSTGSILTATSGFTDVFGYSLAEIKSKHVTSLASETSEWDAMLHAILAKVTEISRSLRQRKQELLIEAGAPSRPSFARPSMASERHPTRSRQRLSVEPWLASAEGQAASQYPKLSAVLMPHGRSTTPGIPEGEEYHEESHPQLEAIDEAEVRRGDASPSGGLGSAHSGLYLTPSFRRTRLQQNTIAPMPQPLGPMIPSEDGGNPDRHSNNPSTPPPDPGARGSRQTGSSERARQRRALEAHTGQSSRRITGERLQPAPPVLGTRASTSVLSRRALGETIKEAQARRITSPGDGGGKDDEKAQGAHAGEQSDVLLDQGNESRMPQEHVKGGKQNDVLLDQGNESRMPQEQLGSRNTTTLWNADALGSRSATRASRAGPMRTGSSIRVPARGASGLGQDASSRTTAVSFQDALPARRRVVPADAGVARAELRRDRMDIVSAAPGHGGASRASRFMSEAKDKLALDSKAAGYAPEAAPHSVKAERRASGGEAASLDRAAPQMQERATETPAAASAAGHSEAARNSGLYGRVSMRGLLKAMILTSKLRKRHSMTGVEMQSALKPDSRASSSKPRRASVSFAPSSNRQIRPDLGAHGDASEKPQVAASAMPNSKAGRYWLLAKTASGVISLGKRMSGSHSVHPAPRRNTRVSMASLMSLANSEAMGRDAQADEIQRIRCMGLREIFEEEELTGLLASGPGEPKVLLGGDDDSMEVTDGLWLAQAQGVQPKKRAVDPLSRLKFVMDVEFKHRFFQTSVRATCEVALGGTDSNRIFELHLSPQAPPIGTVVVDPSGAIMYANTTAESLLCYSAGGLVGVGVDRLIPGPASMVHSRRLRAGAMRGKDHSQPAPCSTGRAQVLVGKHHVPVCVGLSWSQIHDVASNKFLLVMRLSPPKVDHADISAWGFQAGPQGAADYQICLKLLVSSNGRVVACAGGVGMIDEGSPGDIFGPKVAGRGERDFVGKNVVHLVDILAAALSSARSYNAAIRAEQALRTDSFRSSSFRNKAVDNTANLNVSSIAWQGRAPCRLRVSSLDKSGVRVGQTDTAGLAAYVFEVWSADHLTGAAMVSRDSPGVFQKANHHLELLCGMPASKLIGVPLSTIITASGAQSADPLVVSSGSRRSIATTLSHADGMSIQSVLDAASKETARGSFGMLLRAKEDRGALDVVQLLRQTDGVLERTENARKKGNDARAEVERAEGVEVEPDSASDDSDASEGSDRGAASGAASVSGASAATGWTEAMIEGGGASTARQEETMRREIEDAAVRRKQLRDVLESTGLIASVRSMLTRILALAIMAAVMNAGVSAAVLAVLFQVFAELSRHDDSAINASGTSRFAVELRVAQAVASRSPVGAQLGDIAPHIDLQRSASLMFDHAKDRMVAFGPGARRQGRAAIEYASALEQVVTFSGESHVQDHHHMMAVPDEQLDSCPTSAQVERRSMVGQDYVAVELEFEGRTLDADVALDVSLLPELDMLVSQKMQLVADMDAVRMAAALGDDDFGFVVVNTELALRPSLSELLQRAAQAQEEDVAAAMRNAHNAILGTMLAQALGCMPMLVGIAIADALMLNHWRGSLLCLFVAVPSAVLYFLTTKQLPTSVAEDEADEDAMLDRSLWREVSSEEIRAAQLMLIGKTRRVRKSFFSPTAPKRPPRLWDKSIIWTVLPLAASAMLFIFTLRSVELRLLGEAKPRVRYLTDAARIRDMSASLRFWASELVLDAGGLRGDITPRLLPDTMSSEQDVQGALRAKVRAEADMMEETWTQLMLGTSARHPVGLGQTSTQIRDVIFDVECLRGSDAPPCPASGDPLHAATSGGLDAAIGGLHHAALLLVSSPPDDLALGMDLPWFRAVWELSTWDVSGGLLRIEELVHREANDRLILVALCEGLLVLCMLVLSVLYVVLTRPIARSAQDEVSQAAKLLSHLPSETQALEMAQAMLYRDSGQGPASMHRSHGQAQRSDVLGNPLRDMAVVFREYVVKRVLGSKRYSNWLAFRRHVEAQARAKQEARLARRSSAHISDITAG